MCSLVPLRTPYDDAMSCASLGYHRAIAEQRADTAFYVGEGGVAEQQLILLVCLRWREATSSPAFISVGVQRNKERREKTCTRLLQRRQLLIRQRQTHPPENRIKTRTTSFRRV